MAPALFAHIFLCNKTAARLFLKGFFFVKISIQYMLSVGTQRYNYVSFLLFQENTCCQWMKTCKLYLFLNYAKKLKHILKIPKRHSDPKRMNNYIECKNIRRINNFIGILNRHHEIDLRVFWRRIIISHVLNDQQTYTTRMYYQSGLMSCLVFYFNCKQRSWTKYCII